jgi:FkbM family methyltransferase
MTVAARPETDGDLVRKRARALASVLPAQSPIARSLGIYYGDGVRDAAMDALYGKLVFPGELAFDIGAHVGDRVAAFRRLHARVVALEPQPACLGVLDTLYGDDPMVTIARVACGPSAGSLTLHVNSANPTVSTASSDFIRAADGAGGWETQIWDEQISVPVTTLDALIAAHGVPVFAKIDVEGFEDEVLAGLSRPLRSLSFEFTTIQRDVAARCVQRLEQLAPHAYNVALGESQHLSFETPVPATTLIDYVNALPHEANSGDVYAFTLSGPGAR